MCVIEIYFVSVRADIKVYMDFFFFLIQHSATKNSRNLMQSRARYA